MNHEESFYSSKNNITNDWYSVAGNVDDQSYCEYCFKNFKQYKEILNGQCTSCGRPIDWITKNKQENVVISSLSEKKPDEMAQGISLVIDTDPAIYNDPTGYNNLGDKRNMTANSIGEAMDKLRLAEQSTNSRFTMVHEQYKIKTTHKPKSGELSKD